MYEYPVHLVIGTFNAEQTANGALKMLSQAKREQQIGILDAAVIWRGHKQNRLHIKETEDVSGGRGAAAGGVIGAIIGLLAGPPGVVVGGAVGALVGGAAARVIDTGIPNERLNEIGKTLKPGTSAIVAIVEDEWLAQVQTMLTDASAEVLTESLKGDLAEQLNAADRSAHRALDLGEAVADGGMIGTDAKL